MIRRPPRSTRVRSSAASDVYKRQAMRCDREGRHAGERNQHAGGEDRPRQSPARPRSPGAHPLLGATVLEVPSTRPEALTARTWKKAAAGAGIVVSKPVCGVVETAVMCAALEPVSSCQEATVVAPFQLA